MKTHFLSRCLPLLLLLSLLFCACAKEEATGDVPDGCLRAENEAVDYTFCYADDWELDRNDGMIGIKHNVGGSATLAYASISVMSFTLADSSAGANNYWEQYRADLEDLYGERIAFESEKMECTLGGVPANRNHYTLQLTDMTYTYEQVVCVRAGAVYLITLTAPEGGFDSSIDCFDTVISTFAFK